MAWYHVSSSLNRSSILARGLDWRHMAAAPGIAGSRAPEQEGCFLARDEWETDFFVQMNNTGGPVDVWEVVGVDDAEMRKVGGFEYLPRLVPPGQVRLLRPGTPEQPARQAHPAGKRGRTVPPRRARPRGPAA